MKIGHCYYAGSSLNGFNLVWVTRLWKEAKKPPMIKNKDRLFVRLEDDKGNVVFNWQRNKLTLDRAKQYDR